MCPKTWLNLTKRSRRCARAGHPSSSLRAFVRRTRIVSPTGSAGCAAARIIALYEPTPHRRGIARNCSPRTLAGYGMRTLFPLCLTRELRGHSTKAGLFQCSLIKKSSTRVTKHHHIRMLFTVASKAVTFKPGVRLDHDPEIMKTGNNKEATAVRP